MTRARDIADTQDNVGGSVPPFLAGKNACINGDFRINQRGFSTTSTNGVYTFDRWVTNINGTATISAQTFTAGTAPVTGYEAINFIRLAASSQGAGNYVSINQRIEDVRVFANQTFTVSFWAKASSGTPKVSAYIGQTFGSGGSAAVYTYGSAPTITTSWARYSITITAPSISGKTIGTGSYLDLGIEVSDSFNTNLGAQNATIDVWGVQAEAGNVATPFTTATGTIQGELAACKRYYERRTATSTQGYSPYAAGYFNFSTSAVYGYKFETQKRVQPTITFGPSVGQFSSGYAGNGGAAATALTAANISQFGCLVTLTPSGTPFTSGQSTLLLDAGSATSYVEISAEL